MRIVALDPGGTTGWAMYDDSVTGLSWEFTWGQIGPDEHHLELWDFLGVWQPDIVISERFDYQRRDLDKGINLELISREYIGIAKLWCQVNRTEHVLSMLANKSLFDDAKLKKLDLWPVGRRHAADAMRHLLHFMVVKQGRNDLLAPLKP